MADSQLPIEVPPRRAIDEPRTSTETTEPLASVERAPAEAPGLVRPPRPPVVAERAEVIESSRPGRIQQASERVWATALLFGTLALITAWISHSTAVDDLVAGMPADSAGADGRQAARILHYLALALTGVGVLVEALLLAFLRRRGIALRIVLTLFALAAATLLPLALDILGHGTWLAIVVRVGLITHVVGAVLGSVLMWLPPGVRRPA